MVVLVSAFIREQWREVRGRFCGKKRFRGCVSHILEIILKRARWNGGSGGYQTAGDRSNDYVELTLFLREQRSSVNKWLRFFGGEHFLQANAGQWKRRFYPRAAVGGTGTERQLSFDSICGRGGGAYS